MINEKELKWYENNMTENTPNSIQACCLVESIRPFMIDPILYDNMNRDIFEIQEINKNFVSVIKEFYSKQVCNSIGIWGPCWKSFCKQLSEYIGDKKVLEVGCGNGLLALGLEYYDTKIIPTNENPNKFDFNTSNIKINNRIEYLEAKEAIKKYKDEVDYVLISWPPYEKPMLEEVFNLCNRYKLKLIYIGEEEYGCNGSESFWSMLDRHGYYLKQIQSVEFYPFASMHDMAWTIEKD